MRYLFIVLFITCSSSSFSQNAPKEDPTVKFIPVKNIHAFIDSIRNKLLTDTLKFKKEDIAITSKGKRNAHSYSPVFFINLLYQYKLDIVSGNDVLAFVNEILVADKIQDIHLLPEPQSLKVFGDAGRNGSILVQLKDIKKVDLTVAGFKFIKTSGNNFH